MLSGQQIAERLKPHLVGDTLTLAAGAAPVSAASARLLTRLFSGRLVAAVGAPAVGEHSVAFEDARLRAEGLALHATQPELAARIEVSASAADELELDVRCHMPAGYVLHDSFPSLEEGPLGGLAMSHVTYELSSAAADGTLGLDAELFAETGPLAAAAAILGQNPKLAGPIALTASGHPEFDLVSQWIDAPAVSGIHLRVALAVGSRLMPPAATGHDPRPAARLELHAELVTPALTIPAAIGLREGRPLLFVRLNPGPEPPKLTSLSQLAGFTGGADPAAALAAAGTPAGRGLSIRGASATIDPATLALSDLTLAVGLDVDWTIIDGVLGLQDLTATVTVANPLEPRTASVGLVAGIGVGQSRLDAEVHLPEKIVSIGLAPGDTIPVNDLLRRVAGDLQLPGRGDLEIETLSGVADIGGGSYQLAFEAVGQLEVITGFELDDLSFELVYAKGRIDSAGFGAELVIARVPLYVRVAYATGGWTFAGGVIEDSDVKLSELAADLALVFGVTLPAGLPEVVLKQLELKHYSTADGSFEFAAEVAAFAPGNELLSKIGGRVTVAYSGSGTREWTGGVTGTARIGDSDFTVSYDFHDHQKVSFRWKAAKKGESFGIEALWRLLGTTGPAPPPGLDLGLDSASIEYDITSGTLLLTAHSVNYGTAVFVHQGGVNAFGVQVPLDVTLADIPLVGDKLPEADQLGVRDMGLWLVSGAPLARAKVTELNALLPSEKGSPRLPAEGVEGAVSLFGNLMLGSSSVPLGLALGASAKHAEAPLLAVAPPARADDDTKWFDVHKSLGVFSFERIGVQYLADGTNALFFVLDASILLGPVTFSMQGLAVGSPLTKFEPRFHLSGLGLSYVQEPLAIEGAFFVVPGKELSPDTAFQYDGLASVRARSLSLAAVGSYAQLKSGDPSLFVFGEIGAPIGGPPEFFVTGLMGGFGYNRSLELPHADEVLAFPLVALSAPPAPGSKPPGAAHVLDVLEGRQPAKAGGEKKHWIAPRSGDMWLAAGIQFTTYKLLDTTALLVGQFGSTLALSLLGVMRMRLPPEAPDAQTYAFVELQLAAVVKPLEGVVEVGGALSEHSYVLAPACHLTGGFALAGWFGDNPNAGQFVATLGGYHPGFKPPAHFPEVPRLGLNWAVSDDVVVKGGVYLAVTPALVMAGGALEVSFTSGRLRAWFTAHADLLAPWHPFSFEAQLGVSVGVSYQLGDGALAKTLTASVGATVDLFGPPTGGTATVHLWTLSFSVEFGAKPAEQPDKPLDWNRFRALLPDAGAVCTVAPGTGLQKELEDPAAPHRKVWVVRPAGFAFTTESAIPSTAVAFGAPAAAGEATGAVQSTDFQLAVRPMNLPSVRSTHRVRIRDLDTGRDLDVAAFAPATRSRTVPEALWGKPLEDAKGNFTQRPRRASAGTIAAAPVGASLALPAPRLGPGTGRIAGAQLAYEPVQVPHRPAVRAALPLRPDAAPSRRFVPVAEPASVARIERMGDEGPRRAREALTAALARAGVYSGPHGGLDALAHDAERQFTDAPMVQA